ncbi:hypothetical protein [Raineyella sp. LH-20]|uniref:hypothetical protein n=1 Tax=Raineyella sp. LH-20 TaxID=3081204 RepID=UPI002952E7C7|nr:hypothetical protein [Raineyella sp. LH-20]WOP17340.1 hypothetical protein R0146_08580 [Raineyella sp. LH-20]
MATWQDGPEYAPLAPPTGYEPAVASTPAAPTPLPRVAPAPGGPGAGAPTPAFAPPSGTVPLAGLGPARRPSRDPRHPFPAASRPQRTGSAWRSVHAAGTGDAPTVPQAAVIGPYAPSTYPPGTYAPEQPKWAPRPTGFADLDHQVRAARWLLLPIALYILGAIAGPFVTIALLTGAILLAAAPAAPAAARVLSRIVAGLVGALLLLGLLVGGSWTEPAGAARLIGLVYCIALASWYVRQRSVVDAERRRREQHPGGTGVGR